MDDLILFNNCIEACYSCATACDTCTSQCLRELDAGAMTTCIQQNRECAAICRATAELMSLNSQQSALLCHLCAEMCTICAGECEKHGATMQHCKACAEKCRLCARICRKTIEEMPRKMGDSQHAMRERN